MADVKSFEKLRPCGGLEKFCTSRHNLKFYSNVGVTAAYSCPSSQHSLQSIIFAALRNLINRHSILSAIPLDEDKRATYFARLPSVDLRTCTRFIERKIAFFPTESCERDEELDAILEQQHNSHWRDDLGTKPFWNVIVLHSPNASNEFLLSWVFHHAISDGTSGLVFHRTLLAALNSLSGNATLEDDPIVKSPTTDLIPSIEKLHKLPLSWSFIAKEQWNDWFPKRHPKVWTGAKITSDQTSYPTKFQSLVLSKENTAALVALSRENKTTLSGALQCIAACAVLANLDPAKHDRVRADGAISLRRFLQLPDKDIEDQIGVYVGVYYLNHVRRLESSAPDGKEAQSTALDLFSWVEAQQVRAAIMKELARDGKNCMVGLLRWVPFLHSFFLGKIGHHRAESFEFSNLGVFRPKPEEQRGEWKVGRMVFSQDASVCGSAFEYSTVTGGDGCCVLGFSWLEGVVQEDFMLKVIHSVKDCVEGIVGARIEETGGKTNGVLNGHANGQANGGDSQ